MFINIIYILNKTNLKPVKPVARVRVRRGYLKPDPYPYPSNPYPGTRVGFQTRAMH